MAFAAVPTVATASKDWSPVASMMARPLIKRCDKKTNEFKDGETLFLRGSVWRESTENVAETLTKGTRVIAQGRLKSRSYDTKEGEKRTVMELECDEIGPSLRYASATVNRRQPSSGGGHGNQGNSVPAGQQQDPWAAQANSSNSGNSGNSDG